MEASLTESVQQLVRPGQCTDIYYPDPETAKKACFRTTQNTRYVQSFTNLGQGSNTLIIPPNNGVGDVVLALALPAGTLANLALCRGWGYALIKSLSFRYAGASQYFMSGQQILQAVLSQATDGSSRDALLSLGGDALSGSDFATQRYAYVWLPLPHCVPTSRGKPPPFPSDLVTQSIQITCELYPLSQIFSIGSSGSLSTVPSSLSAAEFVVNQIILENQGDALARRVDMTSHALSMPITFRQQEVSIQLNGGQSVATTGPSNVFQSVLTGFRAGEVKELHCWLTADSVNTPTPAVGVVQNPFAWYALENVSLTYAGEVYARGDYNSMALWNLVNGRIPAQVNDVRVVTGTAPTITTAAADAWSVLPFSQPYDPETAHSMYVGGKPITNGICNLAFTIPASAPASTYTLHVTYVYNAVLSFSQGTCDYVF